MICFLVGSYRCGLFSCGEENLKHGPLFRPAQTPVSDGERAGPDPQEASPRWCAPGFGLLVLLLDRCPSAPADSCSGAWRLRFRSCLRSSAPGGLCHLRFPLLAGLLLPWGCSPAPSFCLPATWYVPTIWLNFSFVSEKPQSLQNHVKNWQHSLI